MTLIPKKFKFKKWKNATDYTTTSVVFVDIDAVNLPPLSLRLAVGDVVKLELDAGFGNNTAGDVTMFDWLIDRPTSADTSVRAADGAQAAAVIEQGGSAPSNLTRHHIQAVFVATEAGVHTFKPQWRVNAGTSTILQTGGNYETAILHMVTNLEAPSN